MRMAGLIDGLASEFEVIVATPGATRRDSKSADAPRDVRVVDLPAPPRGRTIRPFLHVAPRLGRALANNETVACLRRLVAEVRPGIVVWTHSYLAPVLEAHAVVRVVDFPNLEIERMRSLAHGGRGVHRWSARFEQLKARRWEPQVARRSDIAIAVSEADALPLRRWGARSVVVVPNLVPPGRAWVPSPARGPVTFMGNGAYPPNQEGARFLLDEVWPLVQAQAPDAELRLAGRGMGAFASDAGARAGVVVTDQVEESAQVLSEAAMILAPVTCGGGTQLKVIEALTYGRVVVASPYSTLSAPTGTEHGCLPAKSAREFADLIVRTLREVGHRHELERRLVAREKRTQTWREATWPLIAAIGAKLT